MTEKDRAELRYSCEYNYKYKLYKEVTAGFLCSLGIRDIFQGFANPQKDGGMIGILHLKWTLDIDNETGYFKSIWYDSVEDAAMAAFDIESSKKIDTVKCVQTVKDFVRTKYEGAKPVSDDVLLN
jgi:hypothetical protein